MAVVLVSTASAWTQDPRALRILESCAKSPPRGDYVRTPFALHREMDCVFQYTGYRAEALGAIRNEYLRRAMEASHAGDDSLWEAFVTQPTVTAAIDAAPLALTYAEAAFELRATLIAVAAAPFKMAEAA